MFEGAPHLRGAWCDFHSWTRTLKENAAASADFAEHLVECVGKLLHSIFDQLIAGFLQRDPMSAEFEGHSMRAFKILLYPIWLGLAVFHESLHGRWRNGCDGVPANQCFDIDSIFVGGVLVGGRSP